MDDAYGAFSSPAGIAVIVILASCILLTAVKLIWGVALWSRKSEHRLGESWVGARVEVVEWTGTEGYVRADGELWKAASAESLSPGDDVAVVRADGLMLEVRKI